MKYEEHEILCVIEDGIEGCGVKISGPLVESYFEVIYLGFMCFPQRRAGFSMSPCVTHLFLLIFMFVN